MPLLYTFFRVCMEVDVSRVWIEVDAVFQRNLHAIRFEFDDNGFVQIVLIV